MGILSNFFGKLFGSSGVRPSDSYGPNINNRIGASSSYDGNYGLSDTMEFLGNAIGAQDTSGSNTFLGGLGSLFSKAVTAWDDYVGNTANRENIAYQKEYNEQVFNRADTQYQRTVADLRASGLSSQLAAGAPSTVAGTSSAPQRTVGNESEAISKLIGMITSIKQTNANATLAAAQAKKAESEAALNTAQLPWVDKLNDAQYVTAMANKDYTIAITRLKQLEGDNYTAKVKADISKALSEVNKNNKLIDLYDEQIKLTSAQEGKTQAERKEINQRIEYLKQQEKNLKQEFDNIVLRGTQISAETELTLQKAATAAWDLFKSQEFNLRSGDQQTRFSILGNGWNNAESLASSGNAAITSFVGDVFPERFVPQNYIDMVNSWGTSK